MHITGAAFSKARQQKSRKLRRCTAVAAIQQPCRKKAARLLATTMLFGASLGAQFPAFAQDNAPESIALDPIIIDGEGARGPDQGIVVKRNRSGSKTDTSLRETPQAVSVVTREEIEARAAGKVSEALRYTPGALAEANGNDIRYDWLWVRGYNTYGTVWLDGLVLPGDPSGYAVPSINPYALERVEVIKGPASVLYGQTLPGGLVNLVGKRPQATAHNEVEISTSSWGGVQTSIDSTGPLTKEGDWSYRVAGQWRDMGTQTDEECDRQIMLAPSLTWSPDAQTELTVYGYYQRDNPKNFSPRFYPATGTLIENPYGQIPTSLNMGDYKSNASEFNRTFFALGYEFSHQFSETWTFRQNLRYSQSDQDMFLVLTNPAFAYSSAGTTINRVVGASDDGLSAIDIDNQLEARFGTGALDHTMLFGFEYVHSRSDRKFANRATSSQDYLNPVYGGTYDFPAWSTSYLSGQEQIGVYVQDQARYDRWLATLGLRYDHSDITTTNRLTDVAVNNREGAVSARLGLSYLFDNGLTPYASYSTSFLPTLGADVNGDPYEAQKARQFEVGVKYEPADARGMIGLSLFDLTLENALTPVYSSTGSTLGNVQTGKQRIRGVEIEGKYELTPEIDLLASYAYSSSKVLETNIAAQRGREMLRVPEHQAGLWAQYRPRWIEGLGVSAGVRATSSYQTDTTYLDRLRIPGRALVDIGAEYDFGALNKDFEGTKLRVNVSNLFDEVYVSHCTNATGGSCNYGPRRTITASLKYAW